ncbi:uncharacterized protein GGS22DRAFT_165109 [Annulohypoxylon maeteangense]|uniref:uncharacterized protein n=1 Tax=Annulohypoxylon maeteangense TaxID=1927788 RepID=UPI002008303F|nr:uncharacterized protein GGS22DRAFT_165109 [Annulohypoxylon maeteangense]KAI0884200.1 hypothetical protein GGS22DRAFT_165109 [Annulohypoxylon maeteangense]
MLFSTILVVACASQTIARSTPRIWARGAAENVILTNCTNPSNSSDKSSEVTYYTGNPDSTPDDISTVTTGQYWDWANKTTTGYFSDTGTKFVSVLNPKGQAGDYAGTGDNGYGNFTCWQTDSILVYTNNNRDCYVQYDCNHQGSPASITAASSSSSATATAASSASASASASAASSSSSHLSVGAIVGLSIGAAAGAVLLAGLAAFFLWRHYQTKKANAASASSAEKGPETGVPPLPPKGPSPVNAIWQGPGAREMETPNNHHELHNYDQPTEIYGEALRGELDGATRASELHNYDLPPRYDFETAPPAPSPVNPGAYGAFKGPI